jgi:hypothetical protein
MDHQFQMQWSFIFSFHKQNFIDFLTIDIVDLHIFSK